MTLRGNGEIVVPTSLTVGERQRKIVDKPEVARRFAHEIVTTTSDIFHFTGLLATAYDLITQTQQRSACIKIVRQAGEYLRSLETTQFQPLLPLTRHQPQSKWLC